MSYLKKLNPEEKALLKTVNLSVKDYYQKRKQDFQIQFPGLDIRDTEFKIENKIFTSTCDFAGDFICPLEFKNCFFLNTMFFHHAKFFERISFNHCFCDADLRIHTGAEFLKEFDLIVFSAKGQINIDGGKFNECKWGVIDNGRIVINGGDYKSLNIGYWGGTVLKELSFHFPKIKGTIKVTSGKSKIERLDLFQYSSDVAISIEDIAVNSISIYRFRNEKSLRLSNVKAYETDKTSEFSIVESYLGKAEFYSIDFGSFKSVTILDAHLVDCAFVNTKFPTEIKALKGRYVGKSKKEEELIRKIKLLESSNGFVMQFKRLSYDPSMLNYYEKKRETLRQIKYALSKQGDSVNEQRFHSLEMQAHNRSLTWKKNFWTKFIIKASSWTSDFGQSIHRPLFALLLGHWVLFIMLILCNGISNLSISFTEYTNAGFKLAFEKYFQLINPLRRNEIPFEGYLILVDILMRIWASYMIYNIIRASRRFIK